MTGVRRVAEAAAANGTRALIFTSSLNVYGEGLAGEVDADRSYGRQRDLAHLSKIYGELCLELFARRAGFDLAVLRLGIVYGPSPVEHSAPEAQTVVDKFRRLAEAGEPLPLDDSGRATIGVAHVDDVVDILLAAPSEPGVSVANVAAETITVADVAALVRGEEPRNPPAWTVTTPFGYRRRLTEYLRR